MEAYNFIKKRLQHSCFPVNIAKFLSTAFSSNTSGIYFCQSQTQYLIIPEVIMNLPYY